jgi:hypothetical protein
MVGGVQHIKSSLTTVVAGLDPSSVPVSSVVGSFGEFDQIERLRRAHPKSGPSR